MILTAAPARPPSRARARCHRLACHDRAELVDPATAPPRSPFACSTRSRRPRPPLPAEDGQCPGGVVDGEPEAPLRVQAAPRPQVSQRRTRSRPRTLKFSFERYKGAGPRNCRPGSASGDRRSLTVRFHLTEPGRLHYLLRTTPPRAVSSSPRSTSPRWGTRDSASTHRRRPYKFVSHKPGVEVVLEANADTGGTRRTSQRVTMKSVPRGPRGWRC